MVFRILLALRGALVGAGRTVQRPDASPVLTQFSSRGWALLRVVGGLLSQEVYGAASQA